MARPCCPCCECEETHEEESCHRCASCGFIFGPGLPEEEELRPSWLDGGAEAVAMAEEDEALAALNAEVADRAARLSSLARKDPP